MFTFSVQNAVGDRVLALLVVWAVREHILPLLDEVLDLLLDVVDLALDFALETHVIDVGLLDLLAIAGGVADKLLAVALLEDFLGVDPGCVDHVLDIGHGGDALVKHGLPGFIPDSISAGLTVLANLWERLVNILDPLPLREGLTSHLVAVGIKSLIVGPLVVQVFKVNIGVNVVPDFDPVSIWLRWARAAVEFVSLGAIPAEVGARCWLSWASAELARSGAEPSQQLLVHAGKSSKH